METVRDRICAVLRTRPHTALQISAAVGIAHRDVVAHLEHLQRSAEHRGEVLRIEAARCAACEYTFEDRARLGRPSRCPVCRGQRIQPPRFELVDGP